jgi:hypothetical protein
MKTRVPFLGLMVFTAACTQYATRPPTDALTPSDWVPTNAAGPRVSDPARPTPSAAAIEERLRALRHLEDQGLITADEAKKKRQEILRAF